MKTRPIMVLGALLSLCFCTAMGQSPAAMQKVAQKYSVDQLGEMKQATHYKYEGMLLYYSSSFLVLEDGQSRPASETEIQAIDLDSYQTQRQEKASVTVHDATLQKDILLLSRDEFETLVLSHLNATDKQAFLSYKSAAIMAAQKPQDQ